MASQIDTTKWIELTEDSESEDDLSHSFHKHGLKYSDDQKKCKGQDDPSLSQYSLYQSGMSSGFHDASTTKPSRQNDFGISMTSFGPEQLSTCDIPDETRDNMENTNGKKFDMDSLRLQFQSLLADDSQDSTQLSSSSDQQGSTTDDPWKSATKTSEGASLSEYPLTSHKHMADDGEQTEGSSGCEEAVNTAISEVSKDFLLGQLSPYQLQSAESDLSSDDQKVLQRHLGGKYPESAIGMSDSDWNVTESDNNASPRHERTKVDHSISSMSSFSPPFSSTVLTSNSTGFPKQELSIIQEASIENTASFKELPTDISVSKGSFLGRDHTKYLDSMRTLPSTSMTSVSFSRDMSRGDSHAQKSTGYASQSEFRDSQESGKVSGVGVNKSSNALTAEQGDPSSSDDGFSGNQGSHNITNSSDQSSFKSIPVPILDIYPSKVDLARKSEQILEKTLAKLNLHESIQSRYSFPLSGSSSPNVKDDHKRHSLGRLESQQYTMPSVYQSRLDPYSRSNRTEEFTRSMKSTGSDSNLSSQSEEVARLMARTHYAAPEGGTSLSGASKLQPDLSLSERERSRSSDGRPSVPGGGESYHGDPRSISERSSDGRPSIPGGGKNSFRSTERPQDHSISEKERSVTTRDGRPSMELTSSQDIGSRVNLALAQTAYVDKYGSQSIGSDGRMSNPGPSAQSMSADRSRLDLPPPPPPPPLPPQADGSQMPSSDQPLPPPPAEDDSAASLDYRRLQLDLQEIQNSLKNNLDFDSGNESERARTPVHSGSETGSEIIPSTTTTPDRSRRLMWDYGADIASGGAQGGRFTSRDTDANDTDNSESRRGSYVDQAQVAHNASRRQPYNSEGEETHTSASSGTKDRVRTISTDDEQHVSRSQTPTNRNVEEVINSFRAQRSMLETQYLLGMANQVSNILAQQDPSKQAHGILDEVRAAEQELQEQLANRPAPDSSFTDTSVNMSNRSLVISDSDVRKRLEMSGLSSPDRSRLGNSSFMEFSTPRKVSNPFSAFSNAKTFLSSQLEEMSNKTFNHSIELRTPLRNVIDCYPMYGVTQDNTDKTDGATVSSSSRVDTRDGTSAESLQSRSQPEGMTPEEFASRVRLTPDMTPSIESAQSMPSMTDRRAASSPSREMAGPDRTPLPPGNTQGRAERADSPPSSSPTDASQYRGDKLRPYRPAGSRDVYYTESDTGSVADSITTMESTHTGSDDAVAPYFPPHVLGSRKDEPGMASGSRKSGPNLHHEQALSTIEEKSVTEERDRASTDSVRSDHMTGQDNQSRPERALDGVRPRSPRDTFSKLDTRQELDSESGIGSRSNFTSTVTDSYQERRDLNGKGIGVSSSSGSQLERDETLRAARKVLGDLDGQQERTDSSSQGNLESRLRSGQSSSSQGLLDSRSTSGQDLRSRSEQTSSSQGHLGDRLRSGESISSQGQVDSRLRSGQSSSSRDQFDSRSTSGQNLRSQLESSSQGHLDSRSTSGPDHRSRSGEEVQRSSSSSQHLMDRERDHGVYNSQSNVDGGSADTLGSRISDTELRTRNSGPAVRSSHSSDTRPSGESHSSVRFDSQSGRSLVDSDPCEGRLRSRSDGDLIVNGRESSSPVRGEIIPEPSPQQSPIHPHTLRESQMHSDPRHSTAIDSSGMEQRNWAQDRPMDTDRHLHREGEGSRSEREQRGQSSVKDGRPRSTDRKDSRQRMEQNRKARMGRIDISSSEDDSNRVIDRAPVSRPAQLLREALEQEVDPKIPADINMLWQRFQELNATDSDTSLNTTRMETLAHLLRNPAKHLVQSYFDGRESERRANEEQAAEQRERRREERRSEKQRNASETESNGSYVEAGNKSAQKESRSVKRMNKKNSRVHGNPDSENLYSIPEDMSFDRKKAKLPRDMIDPNMEKLREKIERQKDKIERERRKELKRMEKLVKLESLLSAKKKGKISESTLMDQLEYISTTSVPDSTEEITESTLTMSAENSEVLTDDTTPKDSSIEMQMAKLAWNQSKKEERQQENMKPKEGYFDDNSRKAEKVRTNERLKEQRSRDDKKRRSKERFPNEEESLYDYREVDIQIVDKPRSRHGSPTSNRKQHSPGRMRDAATNYPSPVSQSPKGRQRTKQRRTKSEAIQTTPNLYKKSRSTSPKHRQRENESVPFKLREARSRSPPFSRQYTPESMENQQPKRKQKKLPPSPKGIAWYVEVPEQRPWRQPLRERQVFAARQAWPDRKSQWQTTEPGEEIETESKNEVKFIVDPIEKEVPHEESLKLVDERYTGNKKSQSLQDAFNKKMQSFVSRSRERQKRMALAAEHRHMQDTLRRERERIFADKRRQEANPNAHPLSENLLNPKKRVFSRQEQKEMTKKMYNRLPEVKRREAEQKRENEYKLNRLKAKVFTKRIQRHVLIKAGTY